MSVCLLICLFFHPYVHLSACLSICLSVHLSACLSLGKNELQEKNGQKNTIMTQEGSDSILAQKIGSNKSESLSKPFLP